MDELIQQASMGGYRLQGTILLENFQDKHTTTYDLRKPIRSEKAQYANNDPRKKALKDNANNTNNNNTNKTNAIKTGNNIVTKSSNNSALSGKSTAGAKSTKTVLENINEDEEDEDQQQQQGNNTATNNTTTNKIATLRKKWEDDGLLVGDYVRVNNHIFSVVKITSKYLVYSFISIILFTAYSHIVYQDL